MRSASFAVWRRAGRGSPGGSGRRRADVLVHGQGGLVSSRDLNPDDYDVIGLLGVVSSSIREGGTGEIIYSQGGTRRTCGARSEDAKAIAKGTEVMVTRYEKGLAYVRPWEEVTGEEDSVVR